MHNLFRSWILEKVAVVPAMVIEGEVTGQEPEVLKEQMQYTSVKYPVRMLFTGSARVYSLPVFCSL